MGRVLIKEAPDVDYYIEWSSVVDAPAAGGTREQMLAYLYEESPYKADAHPVGHTPEDRLARADTTGTSAMWGVAGHPREGSWEDTGFIFMQRGWLPRAKVGELTRRLAEDWDADVSDLLEPLDDA